MVAGFDVTELVKIGFAVVGVFSMVAALTPNTKDDGVLKIVQTVINAIGGNYLGAKNEG